MRWFTLFGGLVNFIFTRNACIVIWNIQKPRQIELTDAGLCVNFRTQNCANVTIDILCRSTLVRSMKNKR